MAKAKLTPAQAVVLGAIKQHGPIADHVLVPIVQHESPIRLSSSGIRTRRAELESKRLVHATGVSVPTGSGRKALLWKAAKNA